MLRHPHTMEAGGSHVEDTHDEMLARYLNSHEVECPQCGYNLRRLRTTRCPECGHALRLTIGAAQPDLRLFMLGLVALSASFGYSAINFLTLVWFVIRWGPGPGVAPFALLGVMALITGTLMVVWCGLSTWLPRRRLKTQITLVTAAWAVPILYFIAISGMILL